MICQFLADAYSTPVISLDAICRELLHPGNSGWSGLKTLLSDDFFISSGEVDRGRFRQALFSDAALRIRVDALLHPLARQEMEKQAAAVSGPVLAEIPLLFEAGWQDAVQQIIVVYADLSVRLQRIMQRDRVSEEQARQAIAAQQSLAEKAAVVDYVIDNSGNLLDTCILARQLAAELGLA